MERAPPDEWDELIAQNTPPDPQGGGNGLSLALAALHAEHFWGAHWWFNPTRWDTPDGYVPWQVFWVYWQAIRSVRAVERLQVMRATRLAGIEDRTAFRRAMDDEVRDAEGR